MKLFIEKGRDFNLENHLEIFDYLKTCKNFKTKQIVWNITKGIYSQIIIGKHKEICSGKKMKINNKLSDK